MDTDSDHGGLAADPDRGVINVQGKTGAAALSNSNIIGLRVTLMPVQKHQGRGALGNATSRYDTFQRQTLDDGRCDYWEFEEDPALRTTVLADHSRTIISTNDSPDVPFDKSINPYKACEHGCIYC